MLLAEKGSQPPKLDRGLLSLSWPLLLSVGLAFSANLSDAFFLSRVSDVAAGAVGAVLPPLGVFIVCYSSMALAASAVCSQLLGAGKRELVPATRAAIVYFNLAFGLCVAVLFFSCNEVVPRWLGLSHELAHHAALYIQVVGFAYCLKAVQVAYAGLLNSRGQTRWVLAEAIITNACNVSLNLLVLHGKIEFLPRGARGVALAALLAQAVGLSFTLYVVHRVLQVRFEWRASFSALWQRFVPIVKLGSVAAVEPLGYQAAQTSMAMSLVALGAKGLAARSYALNFFTVTTVLWCAGLGAGAQILVAHRIGEKRFDEASRTLMRALRLGMLGDLLLGCCVWLAAEPLLHLMTQDPELIAIAKPVFAIGIAVECARSVNVIVGGALRSSGDVRFTSFVGAAMMWIVGVSFAWLLGVGLGWGLVGVWAAMALDEGSRAVVNLWRWRAGYWQRRSLVPH